MRALAAQLRLDLSMTLRNGESLLLTMGIPVGLLVFFSLVDVLPIDGDAVDFLAPGTLALAVLSTAFANLAIATGFERSYGVLKRLGTTPLGRPRLVVAKVLTTLAVLAVQATVLVAAAVALGWRPHVEPLPLVASVVLATVAFTGMALVLAGRLPALINLAASNALFVALLVLSGMVFPLEKLPDGLRTVVHTLPSTALSEALHGAFSSDVGIPGRTWPVLVGWTVVAVGLAVTLFRWEPDGT
jgi:ABC-2 type transport system permease protein